MALVKEEVEVVQKKVGELNEEAQTALVYYGLIRFYDESKSYGCSGFSKEELLNYCNKLYAPQINFNHTQIAKAVFMLEDAKKVATKNYTIDGKDVLHVYPI
jgi:hypothetical protein